MKNYIHLLACLILTVIVLFSCQRDSSFEGDAPNYAISTDTLTFDTVFTSVGSATRFFKIYNNEDEDINVSVALKTPSTSRFRLNVDGISTSAIEDVLILRGDSIYVFVDVTVDPDQPLSISPFIIEEYVTIKSGNISQELLLSAWGQNANYVPISKKPGSLSLLSCDLGMETWDDPRPYVIYGILFIDSCELVIPPGTDIYVHGGLIINEEGVFNEGFFIILPNGKITANGTVEAPITFQGDRLEMDFDEVPGQWVGIRITSGSIDNTFEHVKIKNSIVGIRVDSAAQLSIKNTEIKNTSSAGLIAIHSDVQAENCLIHSNGQNGVILTYGGNYEFNHCTFASYGNQSSAVRFDNFRCSDPPICAEEVFVNALDTRFTNCLFTGNEKDELFLADWTDGTEPDAFQYSFDHCGVTVDEILDPKLFPDFFDHCNMCINLKQSDTLYMNIDGKDFRLDTLSKAIDIGILSPVTVDILGNTRDNKPDLGCFEFVK